MKQLRPTVWLQLVGFGLVVVIFSVHATGPLNTNWGHGFQFIYHVDSAGLCTYPVSAGFIHVNLPLHQLVPSLSNNKIAKVGRIHNMKLGSCSSQADLCQRFDPHSCVACNLYCSVFKPLTSQESKQPKGHWKNWHRNQKLYITKVKFLNQT